MKRFLIMASLLLLCAANSEAWEYKVTGINISTQERVVGNVEESDQNGTISGIIWDRMCTYPVTGTWSGKGGQMRLYSSLSAFEVEVVDE